MTELSDEDLETQLNRRRSRTPLDHGQRVELIESIHARTATNGRETGWLRWRWLAGAAIATALVVVVTIALPRVVSGPTASPSPTSVAPKSLVMNVDEFAAAARDPNWVDKVILARVTLDTRTIIERFIRPCTWTSVCPIALVVGVEPELLVVASPQAGDNGQAGPPSIPSGEAVMAFRVREHDVEYLGEAPVEGGDSPWTVPDLFSQSATVDPNAVYAVSGWLVESWVISCPAPPDFASRPDLSYYCQASWLTPEKTYSVVARSSSSVQSRTAFDGSLNIQNGSYSDFAPDPTYGELGAEPQEGIYLVRVAGCPTYRMGDCPVWKMLGRFDPRRSEESPSPSPETQTGLTVLTASELVAKAADPSATGNFVISNAAISAVLPPTWLDPPELNVVGAVDRGDGSSVLVMGNSLPDTTSVNRAFRILDGAIEYLGPVALTADRSTWAVPNAISVAPADATDDLYPVDGWLLQTLPAPCAAPPDMSSPQDYWCGGSWITSEPTATTDESTVQLTLPQALHVQWDAYGRFADDPQIGAGGGEPRQGKYLVRPAGCPPNVMGDCPVWEMVGRIEPPMTAITTTTPEPSPSPLPSTGVVFDQRGVPIQIDGERVYEGPDIGARVAEAVDDASFLIVGGFLAYGWPDCPNVVEVPLLCGPGGGFQSAKDGKVYQVALVFDGPLPAPRGSLVVLAVHVQDSTASDCPDNYRPQCEQAVVLEGVAWKPVGPTPTLPVSSSAPTASPWPTVPQPSSAPAPTPPTGLETQIVVERPGVRFSVALDRNPMPAGESTGAFGTVTNTDSTAMYWLHDGCASGIGLSGRVPDAYPAGAPQQGVAATFKERILSADGGAIRLAFVNLTGSESCSDIGITDTIGPGESIFRRLVWDGSAWGRGGPVPTGPMDVEVASDTFWHGDPNPDRAAATYRLSLTYPGFAWITGAPNNAINKVQAVDAALAVPDFLAYLETVDLLRGDTPIAWYIPVDQAWFVGIATNDLRVHYVVVDSVSGANRGIIDRPWDPARDDF